MTTQAIFSLTVAAIAFWISFQQIYPRLFPQYKSSSSVSHFSLEKTIRDVKNELVRISATPGETYGLVLQDIEVTLETQRDQTAGTSGALTIPVFETASIAIEESMKNQRSSKVTLVFDAASGNELLEQTDNATLDLAEIVLSTRKALLSTKDDKSTILPKMVKIEIYFAFVKETGVKSEIKAYVFEMSATGEKEQSSGNKIVLTYKNPKYQLASENKAIPIAPE